MSCYLSTFIIEKTCTFLNSQKYEHAINYSALHAIAKKYERRLRDDDVEVARGMMLAYRLPFLVKGFNLIPSRALSGLTLASFASFARSHWLRVGTDMKYLDGMRAERERKRERKEGAKGEEIKKKETASHGTKTLRKGEANKGTGTRTRGEKILRAGWRRLDFISSCRFDVPDACRWPASAFLTNSSPRRPLISALRPVRPCTHLYFSAPPLRSSI